MRRWLGAVLFGLLLAVLIPAAPASAHAALVSTTPEQGSVVGSSPTKITLTFNEPVGVIPGKTQVIAPNGKRVNTGDPVASGGVLTLDVRVADRPLGTYLVSYRIISADGHPLSGGFMFSVGAPSQTAPTALDDDASVGVLLGIAKYAGYIGLTLVVGPLLFLAVLWPRRMSTRGPKLVVWVGLSLLVASTAAALWLQAPYTSGAGPFDVSWTELRDVLTSSYGVALLVRLAVVAAVAVVLRLRRPQSARLVLALLGTVGLLTWPLSGHAAASPVPPVSAVADTLHLASMSVWLGGLVVLVGFLLRGAHPRSLSVILPVWSRWAAVAVCWLVLGGPLLGINPKKMKTLT